MARIETHGLRRTVGLGGLFATAYGNVGSSIYYALGLVAAYALGLTPIVFLLAGGLFALTAKTYAEGASMFPEAGGSSSFARHAFNELVSFFAGWALSLDYILTIAISAFFVPHYLSAFWPALHHPPGDVIGGIVVIIGLAALNIRGIGESAKLNFILAVLDLGDPGPDHHPRRGPDPQSVVARSSGRARARCRHGARRSSHCRWRCSPTRGSRRCRTWPRRRGIPGATSRARSTSS